jgi:hypothetical protein
MPSPDQMCERFWTLPPDLHGTCSPQRKQQLYAAFVAAYLIVIATAAIVTLTQTKPELLLLWYAGHLL